MKKDLMAGTALLTSFLALAGCGGNTDEDNKELEELSRPPNTQYLDDTPGSASNAFITVARGSNNGGIHTNNVPIKSIKDCYNTTRIAASNFATDASASCKNDEGEIVSGFHCSRPGKDDTICREL